MMTNAGSDSMTVARARARLEPVRKTLDVRWSQEAAFRRFTRDIGAWWPLRTHSVGQERARSVVFEERVGGHIYEVDADGGASTWGTVLEWDAPSRVRFTWHPGREPDTAQEVEIRFAPSARGTTLELVHTGWEVLGRDAAKARRGYSIGWIPVLDVWADRRSAAGLLVNGLFGIVLLVQGLAGRRKRSSPSSPSSGRSG